MTGRVLCADVGPIFLVGAGWTLAGSLGAPRSVLAHDIDGTVFEFVERT
jgi:hypothetical protein